MIITVFIDNVAAKKLLDRSLHIIVLQYNKDEYIVLVYIILHTNGQMDIFFTQIQ